MRSATFLTFLPIKNVMKYYKYRNLLKKKMDTGLRPRQGVRGSLCLTACSVIQQADRQLRHCFRATSIRYNFSIKMPGKEIIGVVFEFRREEEGEYVCPKTTVFGLKQEEVATLIENGFKVHNKHPDTEGQEIESSGYNVSLSLKDRKKKVLF